MKEVLVFTRSKKLFAIGSKLLRFYMNKNYSHIAREKEIMGEILYYQASEGKVNYENKSVFDKKHKIVARYSIEVTEEMSRQISRDCLMDAGKKYGFMQNIGIALVDFFSLFNVYINNPFKDGRNCSELLMLRVLFHKYPELKEKYDPDKIRPDQLEQILIDKGYKNEL